MAQFQNSTFDFRSGVLTRKIQNRHDLQIHKSGVLNADNFITQVQGPQEFRPGFEFITHTRRNGPVGLYEFVFDDSQAYTLAFSDFYLRFYNEDGVITEAAKTITNVSKANPGVVTISTHGYLSGDEVYIDGIVGTDELNGAFYLVVYINANTFSLTDLDGNAVSTSAMTAYSSGGTCSRVYEIPTPYAIDEVFELQLDGRFDIRYITSPYHLPRKLIRLGAASWTLGSYTRTSDPFKQKVITGLSQAAAGVVTATAHGYVNGDRVLIEDVAGMTPVNNRVFTITKITDDTFSIDQNTTGYTAYSSGGIVSKEGDQPRAVGIYGGRCFFGGLENDPDVLYGSKSPSSSTGEPQYDDFTVGSDPEDAIVQPLSSLSSAADKIMVFLGTRNFLAVGTYGGLVKVNGGKDGDAIAGDAIAAFPVDANGVAPIRPIAFGSDILYIQRGGEVLFSFQYNIVEDGYVSNNEMVQSDELAYGKFKQLAYTQGRQNIVWALLEDGSLISLTYKRSEDISAWNRHFLGGAPEIISIAGQPQADNRDYLWVCTKREIDGTTRYYLERLVKNPDIPERDDFDTGDETVDDNVYSDMLYEIQKILNHLDCSLSLDTTQDETAISLAAIIGDNIVVSGSSAIFSATDIGREIRAKHLVGGETGIAQVVDYISPTQVRVNILSDFSSADLLSGSWFYTQNTISGLDHLEGEEVSLLIDGAVEADREVVDGQITADGQFSYAIVGLRYKGRLQTMPIGQLLSIGNTIGADVTVNSIDILFRNTVGTACGASPYLSKIQALSFLEGPYLGRPAKLYSGWKSLPGFDGYSPNKTCWVIQNNPQPCTILGLNINSDASL